MTYREKKIVHRPVINSLGDKDYHPLLKNIYQRRDIQGSDHLDYSLKNLIEPQLLKDGEQAADILYRSLSNDGKVLIIGDYDADGATACVLAILVLKKMGFRCVDYLVPNRFEFGYGLSPEIAEIAIEQKPTLVITVDNGINSHEGVSRLKDSGISVIITDHHLPGELLPAADAILNPNRKDCHFPSKNLSGVGVMFYLLMLIRLKLNKERWFENQGIEYTNLAQYLDLVALGTIADVVKLDYNNRILVQNGIKRIRRGQCRPGIHALLTIGNVHLKNFVASDFGFVVAPRLNASGRLRDISTGIECLLADNSESAMEYAMVLNEINMERKEIESKMQVEATQIVREIDMADSHGICLYKDHWHQGVTGLVASRLKEKSGQPAIVFAESDKHLITGSARSIDGLHIKDLLDSISRESPGLIEKFGGHAMAAGLTLLKSNFQRFAEKFHQKVSAYLGSMEQQNLIETDGELKQEEISLANAELIKFSESWGQGFPLPKFDGQFIVDEVKIVGGIHLKMTLRTMNGGKPLNAIAFRAIDEDQLIPELHSIRAVYQMDVNYFRGSNSLQLIIEYFESALLEATC